MITEKGEITTSYLLVQRAQPADSGRYTCHPSNANWKTVLVHVLNGECSANDRPHGIMTEFVCIYIFFSVINNSRFQWKPRKYRRVLFSLYSCCCWPQHERGMMPFDATLCGRTPIALSDSWSILRKAEMYIFVDNLHENVYTDSITLLALRFH